MEGGGTEDISFFSSTRIARTRLSPFTAAERITSQNLEGPGDRIVIRIGVSVVVFPRRLALFSIRLQAAVQSDSSPTILYSVDPFVRRMLQSRPTKQPFPVDRMKIFTRQ